jgi:hypothetical protein
MAWQSHCSLTGNQTLVLYVNILIQIQAAGPTANSKAQGAPAAVGHRLKAIVQQLIDILHNN